MMESTTIRDVATGSSAAILAGFGFNCHSFEAVVRGQRIETIWADPDFTSGTTLATHSGSPIMFPWVNRLSSPVIEFEGQRADIVDAIGEKGVVIHGFVLNRPWRIVARSENSVTGEFHASVDEPGLLTQWPADFRIRTTYTLTGNALDTRFEIDNPDDKPLPFSIGTHTYFRLPLGGSSRDDCVITAPATLHWELVDGLPTGEITPVDFRTDLRNGQRYGDFQVNDILTGVETAGDEVVTSIHDPNSNVTLTQRYDTVFRECVPYAHEGRESVCIEPMTSMSDMFRLTDEGKDVGMRVLQPGEKFSTWIRVEVD